MMSDTGFVLIGDVALKSGPGFSTPIFQTRLSNGIWAQSIGSDDCIIEFVPVSGDQTENLGFRQSQKLRQVGDPALYIYRDSRSFVHIDTRDELVNHLYADYRHIPNLPHLQRTIARFVNDMVLYDEANAAIAHRRRAAAEAPNKMRLVGDPWNNRRFIRRAINKQVVDRVGSGHNILLVGRRRVGKSTLLQSVKAEIDSEGRRVGVVAAQPTESLLEALLRMTWHDKWQMADESDALLRKYRNLRVSNNLSREHEHIELCAQKLSEILEFANMSKQKPVIFIDDIDLYISSEGGIASRATSLAMNCLRRSAVQFVAAGNFINAETVVETEFRNELFGRDCDLFELPVLSISFTEILTVLNSIDQGAGTNENNIRRAIENHFDTLLDQEFWARMDGTTIELKHATVDYLDHLAIEQKKDPAVSSNSFVPRLNNDLGVQLRQTLEHLTAVGILVPRREGPPKFAHRLICDWWLSRSKITKAATRYNNDGQLGLAT